MIFLRRFSIVSDHEITDVKIGFLGFQTASVDLDKAVVNRELAGFNVADIVHVAARNNHVVPDRRAGVIVYTVRVNCQDISFFVPGIIRRTAALNRHIVVFRFALVVECPGNKSIGNLGSVNFTLIGLVTGYDIFVVNGLFASFFGSGRASNLYGLVVPDRGA